MIIGIDIFLFISFFIIIIINKFDLLRLRIIVCINFFSLYEYIIKFNTIKEKRLIIDIIIIRELYEYKEFIEIRWIDEIRNPINVMMKVISNRIF